MWLLLNEISQKFFAGYSTESYSIETTENKLYAAIFESKEDAVRKIETLTNNWKAVKAE